LPQDFTETRSRRRADKDDRERRPHRARAEDDRPDDEARFRRGTADDEYDDYRRRPRRRRDADGDWEDDYRPRRRRWGLEGLSDDYAIELGVWFDYAKEHYTAVLGPMIGYLLLRVLFTLPENIPLIGPVIALAMLFVTPALDAGYAIVAIAQFRGKRWSFGDFFAGFRWYGSLLGNFWLKVALCILCMAPSLLLFLILVFLAAAARTPVPIWLALVVGIINFVPAIYVMVRASCFDVQLIVDRDCGPWEAIQGSWQLSRGHFWGLFGVSLVLGLIVVAGLLACFVGALFAWPFTVMTWNAGYLAVTGSAPRRLSRRDYAEDDHDEI